MAVLLALLSLIVAGEPWAQQRYRETIGRRRLLAQRLQRLAPGMRLAYAEQLLGTPGFAEHFLEGPLAGHQSLTWVEPECYVHAVVDPGGVLRAYSVTTRRRRFAPTFFTGRTMDTAGRAPAAVRLGRTPFAEVGRGAEPPGVCAWLGASRWHYSEGHYFGNPGYYLYYVYSLNPAGLLGAGDDSYALLRVGDGLQTGCFRRDFAPVDEAAERFWADPEVWAARAVTAVNTLTVVDKLEVLRAIADTATFGPGFNQVRVVPSEDRVPARPLRKRIAARVPRLGTGRRAKRSAGSAARVSQGC